jgi:hypothetical protein
MFQAQGLELPENRWVAMGSVQEKRETRVYNSFHFLLSYNIEGKRGAYRREKK